MNWRQVFDTIRGDCAPGTGDDLLKEGIKVRMEISRTLEEVEREKQKKWKNKKE